jgi:hypothetical protein
MFTPEPLELIEEIQHPLREGQILLGTRQFDQAKQAFRQMYEIYLDWQGQRNVRYHKGLPLYNEGFSALMLGRPDVGLFLVVLAYIEDLLTYGPDNADRLPAGQLVNLGYRLSPDFLRHLKTVVATAEQVGAPIDRPESLLAEALKEQGVSAEEQAMGTALLAHAETQPQVIKSPLPDNLPGRWERRVFVGGSYPEQMVPINHIRRVIVESGFQAIVASDYDMPKNEIHQRTLIMLHDCRLAVFDITSQGGQLMEIERLRDYQIVPLIVYGTGDPVRPPAVSSMLRTLLQQPDYELKSYTTMDELGEHARDYLRCQSPWII